LLDHESELVIREHATTPPAPSIMCSGLRHLLGFRFAPRIRDLNERRPLRPITARPLADPSRTCRRSDQCSRIEENWDETLRLAASIRAGTVSAFGHAARFLRLSAPEPRRARLAGDRADRAHPVHARRFDDLEQRCRTGSILNKGEGTQRVARAISSTVSASARPHRENQRHRASA
jgi:TnpA family transposase